MSRCPFGLGRIHGRLLRCDSSTMLWHQDRDDRRGRPCRVTGALHPTAPRPNATRDRFCSGLLLES